MLLRTWELITYSFGSVHFHIIDIITNESNYFGVIIGGREILCCWLFKSTVLSAFSSNRTIACQSALLCGPWGLEVGSCFILLYCLDTVETIIRQIPSKCLFNELRWVRKTKIKLKLLTRLYFKNLLLPAYIYIFIVSNV